MFLEVVRPTILIHIDFSVVVVVVVEAMSRRLYLSKTFIGKMIAL